MKAIKKIAILILLLGLILGCRKTSSTPDNQPIAYLTVTPAVTELVTNQVIQFSVKAVYKDRTELTITDATWSSSNSALAGFSATQNGLGTAKKAGSVTLYASYNGVTRSIPVTIYDAKSVTITADSSDYYIDQDVALTATATLSNDSTADVTSTVTWSSSDSSVAQVSNLSTDQGRLSPLAEGTATITADLYGIAGTLSVPVTQAGLVSLWVEPAVTQWIISVPERVRAIGVYGGNLVRDVSDQVEWTVSNGTTSYSLRGAVFVTPTAATTVTVTASLKSLSASTSGIAAAGTLQQIDLWPQAPQWVVGSQEEMQAWAVYSVSGVYYAKNVTDQATWTSSNTSAVGMASLQSALIQAKATGSSTITATYGATSGTSTATVNAGSAQYLQISPSEPTLLQGTLVNFTGFLLDTNGYKQEVSRFAQWSSLNSSLEPRPFEKTGSFIRKTTGLGQIAVATNSRSGRMAVNETTATLSRIEIQPANPVILPNLSVQLKAIGIYSDGASQDLSASVLWSSSNTSVARVYLNPDERGKAVGVASGTATITATFKTTTATSTLTVSSATVSSVSLYPTSFTLPTTHVVPFIALALLSDSSLMDVTESATWYSSAGVARHGIAPMGRIYLVTSGTQSVNAYLPTATGTKSYSFSTATVSSTTILPDATRLTVGASTQLSLNLNLSDYTTLDVTEQTTWTSSDEQIAKVENNWASSGLVTALKAGTVTLKARYKGLEKTKVYTITE